MSPAEEDLPPTSELLEGIREQGGDERLSLGEVVEATKGRAHGLILVILALPEAIPMVGLSAILAVPIFVLGGIMAVRGSNPPIPEWVRERSIPRDKADGAIRRTVPAIRWLERFSRPRWSRFAEAGRLQGMVCLVMAVVLAIPIPGVNIMAAFAVAGIGLGILQGDGLLILIAAVVGLLAVIAFVAVLTGAWGLVTGGSRELPMYAWAGLPAG
jgi:hypothetical protein